MRTFCFSSHELTVLVECDEQNLITKTRPDTNGFVGQHIRILADVMRKHGGFQYAELKRLSEGGDGSNGVPSHRRSPRRSEVED